MCVANALEGNCRLRRPETQEAIMAGSNAQTVWLLEHPPLSQRFDIPLMPSPGNPNTTSTPQAAIVSIKTLEVVLAMRVPP